jgi:hypothetical protein
MLVGGVRFVQEEVLAHSTQWTAAEPWRLEGTVEIPVAIYCICEIHNPLIRRNMGCDFIAHLRTIKDVMDLFAAICREVVGIGCQREEAIADATTAEPLLDILYLQSHRLIKLCGHPDMH